MVTHLVPGHPAVQDGPAHLLLVVVHGGGVQAAVARLQRAADRAVAVLALQLVRPELNHRHHLRDKDFRHLEMKILWLGVIVLTTNGINPRSSISLSNCNLPISSCSQPK